MQHYDWNRTKGAHTVHCARRIGIWLALGGLLGTTLSANAQSLTWLGTLGGSQSAALNLSADGRVVIGKSSNAQGKSVAYRWTRETGMQSLGTLPSYTQSSAAEGISADGGVIVGWSTNSTGGTRAFRWTASEGMQMLPTLGGSWNYARAVSPNGAIIVGESATSAGVGHAFSWTATSGLRDLGTLGGAWSGARNISADGRTIVGWAYNPDGEYHACCWLPDGTAQDLDTLGGVGSQALSVSADGSIVVGWSYNEAALFRAFRWEPVEEMRELPVMPNSYYVWAYDMTDDGGTIVGETSLLSAGSRALRWIAANRVQNLNTVYAALLTDGSILERATAISPDGRYIVGDGIHAGTGRTTEAFLLDTWIAGDTNGDCVVDDSDLLAVLFAFGTPGTGDTHYEDLNKDGIVDDADLLMVLFNFGNQCGS
ncbi:MAG: hypothetical protein KatS3mg019_1397 [Fimbriimonadales bacterium]|nr:MAG: hypothetical protein KatS3mg019_1397 [Fimbriimonadales bacterium]